jgi:hypothetical protein
LQAILEKDPFDTARADGQPGLTKLLGNNLGRGFRVQEAMTNDLAHHFLGAPIVAFGSRRSGDEPLCPVPQKQGAQLEISLAAEPEHASGSRRALGATLPLDQHGKPAQNMIIVVNNKLASWSGEAIGMDLKGHGVSLLERVQAREG